MTPLVEAAHVGLLAEVRLEVTEFAIVHQIAEHLANVVRLDTVANVLTVPTAVNAPVVKSA